MLFEKKHINLTNILDLCLSLAHNSQTIISINNKKEFYHEG